MTPLEESKEKRIKCILIAEDNVDDVFLLERALDEANLGAKRVVVKSVSELNEFFSNAEKKIHPDCIFPDILFLDPILLDGNALEALPFLKAKLPEKIVTIVISSTSEVRQIREAYQAGADTFLPKPVRAVDIINFFTFRGFLGDINPK